MDEKFQDEFGRHLLCKFPSWRQLRARNSDLRKGEQSRSKSFYQLCGMPSELPNQQNGGSRTCWAKQTHETKHPLQNRKLPHLTPSSNGPCLAVQTHLAGPAAQASQHVNVLEAVWAPELRRSHTRREKARPHGAVARRMMYIVWLVLMTQQNI